MKQDFILFRLKNTLRFSPRYIPPLTRRDSAPLGHLRRFAVEFLIVLFSFEPTLRREYRRR